MDISKLTIIELKALGFDQMLLKQSIENNIKSILERIRQLELIENENKNKQDDSSV